MTSAERNAEKDIRDARPIVGRESSNRPLWIGLGLIGLAGLVLFVVLDAGRRSRSAPEVRARASDLALAPPSTPPSLYIPQDYAEPLPANVPTAPAQPTSVSPVQQTAPVPQTQSSVAPVTNAQPTYAEPPQASTAQQVAEASPPTGTESAIIVDGGVTTGQSDTGGSTSPTSNGGGKGAAIATRTMALRPNERALVVPEGTLIGAVLETGLDSTQSGQARALISSDVRARRSTRVLVPKGSRLFGTYQGDLANGQNRILVQWARLVRPDGVTVAIDSPATDRLGRAGIKGRVNTHFLQRLGGALLQSAIDVGTIIAARGSYDSPVLIAVPGRLSGVASDLIGAPPKPTISVRPGTRISVFVVRDLDFSEVEARR